MNFVYRLITSFLRNMRFLVVASFSGVLYGCGGGDSSQLRPVSTDDYIGSENSLDMVGVAPAELESNAAAGVNDPETVTDWRRSNHHVETVITAAVMDSESLAILSLGKFR